MLLRVGKDQRLYVLHRLRSFPSIPRPLHFLVKPEVKGDVESRKHAIRTGSNHDRDFDL